MRWSFSILAGVLLVGLAACTSPTAVGESNVGPVPERVTPSAECTAAFDSANAALTDHYTSHDAYNGTLDEMYEGGASDEEIDAVIEDEEAAYAAIIEPIYSACIDQQEFYSAAYAHDADMYWGADPHGSGTVDQAWQIFISSYCGAEHQDKPACS